MTFANAMHVRRPRGRLHRFCTHSATASIASLAAALIAAVSPHARQVTAEPVGFQLLDLNGTSAHWVRHSAGPVTVTYAFVHRPQRIEGAVNCRGMVPMSALLERSRIPEPVFHQEVRAAFDIWESAANIRFHETSDPTTSSILIGAQEEPDGRAFTNVEERPGHTGEITRSLICLNPQQPWKVGFDGDLSVYDLHYTLAHEIGHAIGLDHPVSGGAQLMSHRYQEWFRTLQPGDISGAVQLYGERGTSSSPSTIEVSETATGKDRGRRQNATAAAAN